MRSSEATATVVALDRLPGHGIRRLHQIAVAIFLEETREIGITPVQYAALQSVANQPGIDQRTLARAIGLDTSTLAGVIDRLETRGLVQRNASGEDRRVRRLMTTDQGKALLAETRPGMLRAQARILAPLSAPQQKSFMRMLDTLLKTNNDLSRAPARRSDDRA